VTANNDRWRFSPHRRCVNPKRGGLVTVFRREKKKKNTVLRRGVPRPCGGSQGSTSIITVIFRMHYVHSQSACKTAVAPILKAYAQQCDC